jgi:hypothetical protein
MYASFSANNLRVLVRLLVATAFLLLQIQYQLNFVVFVQFVFDLRLSMPHFFVV